MGNLGELLSRVAEQKKRDRRLEMVERQLKVLKLFEDQGRQPLRARDIYRQLHMKKEELDAALQPLAEAGHVTLQEGIVTPNYALVDIPLADIEVRISSRPEKTRVPRVPRALPVRALAITALVVLGSLGGYAVFTQGFLPLETQRLPGTTVSNPLCRGFGLDLPGQGMAEVQLERGGQPLAGGTFSYDGPTYFCKSGQSLLVLPQLPTTTPRATAPRLSGSPSLDRFLLVNVTVRDRGSLQDVLIPDFRPDNLHPGEALWAEKFRDGYLVGVRNTGSPIQGTIHLYTQPPAGGLQAAGNPASISLAAGDTATFTVPPGTSYAVIQGDTGDEYLKFNVTGPFGTGGLPVAMKVPRAEEAGT